MKHIKLIILSYILILFSCKKEDYVFVVSERQGDNLEQFQNKSYNANHGVILKKTHPWKCAYHLIGNDVIDSTVLVDQLIYANQELNHGAPSIIGDHDTMFLGNSGNLICETPAYIFDLSDTTGYCAKIQRWLDNGYGQHILRKTNTGNCMVKLIYKNL